MLLIPMLSMAETPSFVGSWVKVIHAGPGRRLATSNGAAGGCRGPLTQIQCSTTLEP